MPEESQEGFFTTRTVAYTIKPVYFLEQCFGVWRVSHDGTKLVPTKAKFTSLLIPGLYVATFLLLLKTPTKLNSLESLMTLVSTLPYIVNMCQYCSIAINTTWMLNDTNFNILKNLATLDSMLQINIDDARYKKCRLATIRSVVILLIMFFGFMFGDLATDDTVSATKLIIYPVFLIRDVEVLVICRVMEMTKERLQVINVILSEFINDKDKTKLLVSLVSHINMAKRTNFIGTASNDNIKILELAKAYELIGETCLLMNKAFNFQILWILISTFTYIVLTIWSSFYYFRNSGVDADFLLTICIWCVAEVVSIGYISLNCERFLVTRNDCKVLVNELIMDYDMPRNMRIQCKTFMKLIEAWPLSFSVYEMFSVDITLMLKFISVATTYLIVIIQIFHFV